MMAFYHFCTVDFLINIASGRINQAINSTTQVISIKNFAIRLITLHRIVHWTATTGTQQNRIDQIRTEQNPTEHNRTEENRKPHLTLPHLQSTLVFDFSNSASTRLKFGEGGVSLSQIYLIYLELKTR